MPWCPNCRSEYRLEITTCSEPDCDNTLLVAELPPDPEILEIYTAADPLEAQHIAGLLRDADIADYATAARELIESARSDEVISAEGEFLA